MDNIPDDWHICDGTNGTIDLRNRFVYGAGGSGHSVGEKNGSETVTLTVEQMPSHNHNLRVYNSNYTSNSGSYIDIGSSYNFYEHSGTNNIRAQNSVLNAGNTKPHTNMPPYIVLYYIEKIK